MAANPVNRRAFLGRLAVLPVAGNELKRQMAKLVGVSGRLGANEERLFAAEGLGRYGLPGEESSGPRGRVLVEILRLSGIPAFKRKEWRQRARRVSRVLDPDIAALHSISVSAAMTMQYKRNIARYESEFFGDMIDEEDRAGWLKRLGLDWL